MTAGNTLYAVIGGGFYGCAIAVFLAECGGAVTLLEAHDDLLLRASYNNQARLHGGYHYRNCSG
jgi:glycine/D-amino acid oxidase-like deaminating enzyme